MDMNVAAAGELDGIEGVFDDVGALAKISSPVVCIIDTQHPDAIREKMKEPLGYFYIPKLRRIAEELSGLRCVAVHYTQIKRQDMDRPNIKAILITARTQALGKAYDEDLFAIIRETHIPTIGFCGGHQLIAQACGAKIDYMRDLKPGEQDPNPKYCPGRFKEWGFTRVKVLKRDAIFQGLKREIVVNEMHAWEITELPDVFDVLAATDECKVEMIRHKEKTLYGTQFHAEHYDNEHPDGKALLRNFFHIAAQQAKTRK